MLPVLALITHVLFSLATHFWIVLAVGAVALVGAVGAGVVPIARVIKAALDVAADIAEFFAKETSAKLVYGAAVALVCIGPAVLYGRHEERAEWKAREAEAARQIAIEQEARDAAIAKQIRSEVSDQLDELQVHNANLKKQVDAYEKSEREKGPPDAACLLSDDDVARLRLGGPEQQAPQSPGIRSRFPWRKRRP